MPDFLSAQLEKIVNEDILLLCVGNPLRGDDAFGPALADSLKGRVRLKVIDAGMSPENFLGRIAREKYSSVLLIDAVDFGARPGEARLLDLDKNKTNCLFMTHNPCPSLIFDFLKENNIRVTLLAAQPKDISFGAKLSPEVEKQIDFLSSWFKQRYPKDN